MWEKIHMPIVEKLDTFHIMSFCVRREEKKAYWQEKFPSAAVYTDIDKFMRQSGMDAVIITTPLNLNGPLALKALHAGKLVFVEKPLATNMKEMQEIAAEEKKSGKQIYVLEQFLYSPQLPVIRDIIAGEKLGKLAAYENITYYLMDESIPSAMGYERTNWRFESDFPLGHIWDGGVHQVALFNALFGLPKKIFAKGTSLRKNMGKYNFIFAIMDYGSNFIGSFGHSAFIGGSSNRFEVHFTNGTLYISADELILEKKATGEREVIKAAEGDLYALMWGELAHLAETGGKPPFMTKDAEGCIKFLTAVEKSIDTNTEIIL
jgi:predicted dehydrogenase